MVLRKRTLSWPMKGPNSELREDIDDDISQFVDLMDGELKNCGSKRRSGLTCATLTAFS